VSRSIDEEMRSDMSGVQPFVAIAALAADLQDCASADAFGVLCNVSRDAKVKASMAEVFRSSIGHSADEALTVGAPLDLSAA
jgi:hypothetical protein